MAHTFSTNNCWSKNTTSKTPYFKSLPIKQIALAVWQLIPLCFPKQKCFLINIYHLGAIKVMAVKVDPFTISHLVLRPLCFERVSNQHTASPHHQRGGKDRETNIKRWREGRRATIWNLPNMLTTSIHRNPPPDPPETKPEESCIWVSKAAMKSCPSGLLPGILLSPPTPLSSVCLGKLLFTHQNPTQLSPPPGNLPCPTSERVYHSSTSEPTINLSTKCTAADHLPRAKHGSRGTRDTAVSQTDKKLALCKHVHTYII